MRLIPKVIPAAAHSRLPDRPVGVVCEMTISPKDAARSAYRMSNTEVNEETLQRLETEYKPPAEHSFRMLRDFANRASKWKQRLPLFVACSILLPCPGCS
jgi:hypothetical protein